MCGDREVHLNTTRVALAVKRHGLRALARYLFAGKSYVWSRELRGFSVLHEDVKRYTEHMSRALMWLRRDDCLSIGYFALAANGAQLLCNLRAQERSSSGLN